MKKTFLCLTLAINTAPCLAMDIVKTAQHINERDKQVRQYEVIRAALKLSNENYLSQFPKGGIYLFTPDEEQILRPQIFANPLACECILRRISGEVCSDEEDDIRAVRTALDLPVSTEPRRGLLKLLGDEKCVNTQCFETNEEFEAVKGLVERGEKTLAGIVEKIIENK